jgi:hypothetical protein
MANYAVIENEIVVNAIVADSKKIAEEATGRLCVELPEINFGIGDTWDGTNFIKPEPIEVIDAEIVPPAIEG